MYRSGIRDPGVINNSIMAEMAKKARGKSRRVPPTEEKAGGGAEII